VNVTDAGAQGLQEWLGLDVTELTTPRAVV
jgi:hypothetical protein